MASNQQLFSLIDLTLDVYISIWSLGKTKDYIERIDVHSQINQPKELPAIFAFYLDSLLGSRYSVDYPLNPTMCLSDVTGGGNIGIIM